MGDVCMLKAVAELGEHIINENELSPEEIFAQKNKLSKTKKVLCVVFEKNDADLRYWGVHTEEYDPMKSNKYLYRIFNHRRYDVTPTARVASVEKVKKRWELWFGDYSKNYGDNKLMKSLREEFERNKDEIFEDLSEKFDELDKKEKKNTILTIKIKDDKEKYVGDFKIFRDIFREEVRKKFFTRKYGREIESKGTGKCNLCKEECEVYGFASPFSVFTVDKKGFAPSFLQEDSWKQLPICEKCAISLVAGREFIDTNLSKNFYGYKFYMIPYFAFKGINENVIEEIKDSGSIKYAKSLLSSEEEIVDNIEDEKDIVSLIFVFYKPKQGDYFDIVKYIEDVPPSWIKILFKTFDDVKSESIFKEEYLRRIFSKKWVNDFTEASFNSKKIWNKTPNLSKFIRTFFPASKRTGVYDKYFIDIIGDILTQVPINNDFLIRSFLRELRDKHANNEDFSETIVSLQSLYLLIFLYKMDLLKGGVKIEEKTGRTIELSEIKEFFENYGLAFNSNSKRAAFLEGVLTKYLMDIQFKKRDSAPFRSKLYGLKLDERKIKKLLPQIIEKLREYKVSYSDLEQLTSEYLLNAENDGWDISKDEISYYFTLGLNLGGIFKVKGDENE